LFILSITVDTLGRPTAFTLMPLNNSMEIRSLETAIVFIPSTSFSPQAVIMGLSWD